MKIWEPKPPGNYLGHTGPDTGLHYLSLYLEKDARVLPPYCETNV